jgi:hypothetical protein
MPRIRREIPAVKIEYGCEWCERGVYRLVSKQPVSTNYVLKGQHRCTTCGDLADFTVPYPLIEVDGKPIAECSSSGRLYQHLPDQAHRRLAQGKR